MDKQRVKRVVLIFLAGIALFLLLFKPTYSDKIDWKEFGGFSSKSPHSFFVFGEACEQFFKNKTLTKNFFIPNLDSLDPSTSALILLNHQLRFDEKESEAIEEYLHKGGKVLMCASDISLTSNGLSIFDISRSASLHPDSIMKSDKLIELGKDGKNFRYQDSSKFNFVYYGNDYEKPSVMDLSEPFIYLPSEAVEDSVIDDETYDEEDYEEDDTVIDDVTEEDKEKSEESETDEIDTLTNAVDQSADELVEGTEGKESNVDEDKKDIFLMHDSLVICANFNTFPNLYVHTAPQLFESLAGRQSFYAKHFNTIMKEFLDRENIYLANAPQNFVDPTPLKELLKSKSLSAAYYLLIALVLLYIISNMRRIQKAIPIKINKENTTKEYVKTLAKLYQQQGQSHQLVGKIESNLYQYIKQKFHLDRSDKNFIAVLSKKSKIDQKFLIELFAKMKSIQNTKICDEKQLIEVYKRINYFKKFAND